MSYSQTLFEKYMAMSPAEKEEDQKKRRAWLLEAARAEETKNREKRMNELTKGKGRRRSRRHTKKNKRTSKRTRK
jgi:hypothetical protein